MTNTEWDPMPEPIELIRPTAKEIVEAERQAEEAALAPLREAEAAAKQAAAEAFNATMRERLCPREGEPACDVQVGCGSTCMLRPGHVGPHLAPCERWVPGTCEA